MVIIVSFLIVFSVLGGVVFCFNKRVEILEGGADEGGVVAGGGTLTFGNVLLALSKGGSSCQLGAIARIHSFC